MPDDDINEFDRMNARAVLQAAGHVKRGNLPDEFRVGGLIRDGVLHDKTHSIGVRPHPHGHAIARGLLGADKIETVQLDETRPLIDLVQEATFGESVSMQFVENKYDFRMLLRKAHCFRLDAATSAMISDFSLAVAHDLEATRHLAIPPFPVTWFEIDNVARLQRIKELGIPLTETASRTDVTTRVGWLITPANDLCDGGYYLSHCTVIGQGVFVAPLSFFWHIGDPAATFDPPNRTDIDLQRVCFGMSNPGIRVLDAFPCCAPWQLYYKSEKNHSHAVKALMMEIGGELRHLWGLLLALGAGHLGAETVHTPQPLPAGPHPIAKGKPLLPLEHKVLTIKLGKRKTPEKITAMAITGVKKRWHEVRGHFRTKYNADGTVKWRIPIKPHERGDERLGRIEKTYRVEK